MKNKYRKLKLLLTVLLGCLMLAVGPLEEKAHAQGLFLVVTVSILVLVVGGIVIYVLWTWAKNVLPPPQTNAVPQLDPASNWQINVWQGRDTNGQLYNLEGEMWGPLNPYAFNGSGIFGNGPNFVQGHLSPSVVTSTNYVVMEYWLDGTLQPGLSLGTNSQPVGAKVFAQSTTGGVSLSCSGSTFTYTFGTGSSQVGVYYAAEAQAGSMTTNIVDADGDVATLTAPPPATVGVEQSEDLTHWTTIQTNRTIAGGTFGLSLPATNSNEFFRAIELP